jgi:hypothetical protein
VLRRDIELRIAAPSDVERIELVPLGPEAAAEHAEDVDVATDVLSGQAPAEAVLLDHGEYRFALRSYLHDGTPALGGAGLVVIEPAGIAAARRDGEENPYTEALAQSFLRLVPEAPGRASLRMRIGLTEQGIPVEVITP